MIRFISQVYLLGGAHSLLIVTTIFTQTQISIKPTHSDHLGSTTSKLSTHTLQSWVLPGLTTSQHQLHTINRLRLIKQENLTSGIALTSWSGRVIQVKYMYSLDYHVRSSEGDNEEFDC